MTVVLRDVLRGWLEKSEAALPNIAMRTLGGRQVWADIRYWRGWRLQENVFTGHCRVIDEQDIRRAWGSLGSCLSALEKTKARLGAILPKDPDHLVIVLHGLGRTRQSMGFLVKELCKGGCFAIGLGYPSTRESPAEHAIRLSSLLDHLEAVTTVSFVTHSLGGIVARHLLALEAPWRSRLKVSGVALIAPPNQGAYLASLLENNLAFRLVAGPAGQALSTERAKTVPPLAERHVVIAGGRGKANGFNPLLKGDNDGIVSLGETDLGPETERVLVKSLHTIIMDHPETAKAVLTFLREEERGTV
jgi:pimeloyl-ACP methyl ester carboxylesterase